MNNLKSFLKSLHQDKSKERAVLNARFFKTGKGEYGEGDIFLGITVPNVRKVLKEFKDKLNLEDVLELLKSKYHEERLAGVLLLVSLYKSGDEKDKKNIFNLYLESFVGRSYKINNWDLVDTSAPQIVGSYLLNHNRTVLHKLTKSKNLWGRRVAVVSAFTFIKNKEYKDTFKICELLMGDKEDLIHKACGWMLREVGKNCGQEILNEFLDKNINVMPRTMLRYAIEKHSEEERGRILGRS